MRRIYVLPALLLVVMCAVGWQGCKKSFDDKAVTVVNQLSVPVTFDLYETPEDYNTNANVLKTQVIAAGEKLIIPGNVFADGHTYYMDWYSEDYYYTNWLNDNYPLGNENKVRITPKPGANTYYLKSDSKSRNRVSFLKGDRAQSTWTAVGAYLYSGSTGYISQWQNLTPDERQRQVVVNKDFSLQYTRKNDAGATVTNSIEFMVHQSEVPYIEFKPKDGTTGNMVGGKHPMAAPPSYESYALDTVMAQFPDHDFYFMMVRQ